MQRWCAALLVLTGCAAMPESEPEIRVRVVDATGYPMQGATVTWLTRSPMGPRLCLIGTAGTDHEGYARIPAAMTESRDLVVTAIGPGHSRSALGLGRKVPPGLEVDLALPSATPVAGVLEDPAGTPISGAWLKFRLTAPLHELLGLQFDLIDERVPTDERGRFRSLSLSGSADYQVTVTLAGQGLELLGPDLLRPAGGLRIVARHRGP